MKSIGGTLPDFKPDGELAMSVPTIAFFGNKGVGKTFLVYHLAIHLHGLAISRDFYARKAKIIAYH